VASGEWRKGVGLALLAACGLLIVAGVQLVRLSPSNPASFDAAQFIIVEHRIPHHALPTVWFNGYSVVRLIVILTAFYVLRNSRLLLILGIPFAGGLIVTLFQMLSGNLSLALLQPWRVSVFLVPICAAILLAKLL